MIRAVFLAAAATLSLASAGLAAEPIVGNWKTASGSTAAITPCGGSYCITLKTGKHAGKKIGMMKGSGGKYSGEITEPDSDKTYSGSAAISGSSLKMKGCFLAVFCKSQTWTQL